MLCLLNLESFLNKRWPNTLALHRVGADGDQAIYFCQYLDILFPYLLIFPELFEEIADKQSHLFFDLLLNVLDISD